MSDLGPNRPSLSEDHLNVLAARGQYRAYAKGETILARGDVGDHILIIDEGLVEISLTSVAGRKSVLSHMGPGEFLGEMSVIDDYPRSADVVALKPTRAIAITREVLLAFFTETPEAMVEMLETLCAFNF